MRKPLVFPMFSSFYPVSVSHLWSSLVRFKPGLVKFSHFWSTLVRFGQPLRCTLSTGSDCIFPHKTRGLARVLSLLAETRRAGMALGLGRPSRPFQAVRYSCSSPTETKHKEPFHFQYPSFLILYLRIRRTCSFRITENISTKLTLTWGQASSRRAGIRFGFSCLPTVP